MTNRYKFMKTKAFSLIIIGIVLVSSLGIIASAGGDIWFENEYYEDGSIKMEATQIKDGWSTKHYNKVGDNYKEYTVDLFTGDGSPTYLTKKVYYQHDGKTMIKALYQYEWSNEMSENVPWRMFQYEPGTDKIKYEYFYEYKDNKPVISKLRVFDTSYEGDFFNSAVKIIEYYDYDTKEMLIGDKCGERLPF